MALILRNGGSQSPDRWLRDPRNNQLYNRMLDGDEASSHLDMFSLEMFENIAYIMAKYGMNVIDSGVAVLSMHALWEVANKADIYEAYRGYKAFLERA